MFLFTIVQLKTFLGVKLSTNKLNAIIPLKIIKVSLVIISPIKIFVSYTCNTQYLPLKVQKYGLNVGFFTFYSFAFKVSSVLVDLKTYYRITIGNTHMAVMGISVLSHPTTSV